MKSLSKAGMLQCLLVLFLNVSFAANQENQEKKIRFQFHPSLGLSYSESNANGTHTKNLQWLGTMNANMEYVGKKFFLSTTLFATYGESKIFGQTPQKLQDAFILSVTPSITIIKKPALRLFLETTAETTLGKGQINGNPTRFFDPLFLYQTLFVGQKHYSYQGKDNTSWDLTYGIGYSFQQTINSKYEVLDDITGNKADFESGFSAIIECSVNTPLTKSINFRLNFKAVALSRENFFRDIDASRRSVLIRSGLFYKMVGIEYNFHSIHDMNLSASNMVDHSIMFTLTF